MPLPPIILASASPRRSALLRQMGLEFQVVPSAAEELDDPAWPAPELAQRNAQKKAGAVGGQFPEALVIGADTLVFLKDRVFGKPKDTHEAFQMLELLQGRTHHVVTGLCLLQPGARRERLFAEISEVTFKPLRAEEIRRYLSLINPLDKAGAYAIQEHGTLIVERLTGSLSNVIGLPMERLQAELVQLEARTESPERP